MKFAEKRDELMSRALELEESLKRDDSFSKDFFNLVSNIVIKMMADENSFFGSFMLQIKREIRYKMGYPLGTIPTKNGYIMYFDPVLFLRCSDDEMVALFKHEIYHIMFSHYTREKELRNSFSKEAVNVALDVAINQFIKDLPMDAMRLDRAELQYNVELKEDMPVEYYAKEIDEKIKKRDKKEHKEVDSDKEKRCFNNETSHDIWENLEAMPDLNETLKNKTAKGISGDEVPEVIKGYLRDKNEAELTWQTVLKRLIPAIEKGYKKTITRRDRRQSERLDLRGKLRDRVPEIIVAIDISGSISKGEFRKIIIEVIRIAENRHAKVKIIECDNKVRKVYDIKSINDLQDRADSMGATAFTPAFEYLNDHKLSNRPVIYFTDGVGEKKLGAKFNKKNIIWVLTGGDELSLQDGPYMVRQLSYEKKEEIDASEGLRMYNEVMRDKSVTD